MELLNKEQRNAGGYVPSRLPTMIVAQQHQMIGTISGQDTVQSNNGSQVSSLRGTDGTEGSSWNDAVRHSNHCQVSDFNYQNGTNARVTTPSTFNTNEDQHQMPQRMVVQDWINDSEYVNKAKTQDPQNKSGRQEECEEQGVSHRKKSITNTLHTLTYIGPGGGRL